MDLTRVHIRDYRPEDRAACLSIFDSNVPSSFTEAERPEFAAFLDTLPGPYLLLEIDGRTVACGGYAAAENAACADLCWGMVQYELQGSGLGRLLTRVRIERIADDRGFTEVALRTSHLTEVFYQRMGFVTERVTLHGIAPDQHKCEMRLSLNR